MTSSRHQYLDAKLAIGEEYTLWENRIRGEQKQQVRVWENFEQGDGEWFCVVCDEQIAQGVPKGTEDLQRGEIHHPIKRRYFPTPAEVHENRYSVKEMKNMHHISNGVVVCRDCHAQFEGFENGRPHLMSWLCKDITGREVPLVLPASSQLETDQRRDWICVQNEIERCGDYQCTACGHTQLEEVTQSIHIDTERSITYSGRDVRAVHVFPPVAVPELTQHPDNLILLCLECLFGVDEHNTTDDSAQLSRWKDEPPLKWVQRFAPHLLRDYEGKLLRQ